MKPESDQLDRQLEAMFEMLHQVPEREPQAAARGRARYLSQVRSMKGEISPMAGVSAGGFFRLKGWIESISTSFRIKERSPMFTTLMTILITVSLLFGGVGVTAYAAQDSLPDDTLYPVKIFSEDVRLYLTTQTQSRLSLLLARADRRVAEMIALSQAGEAIPTQALERWQSHLDQAFQLSAQSGQVETSLEQLRIHLREQEQEMTRLQTRADDPNEPVLARIRAMIQERLRLVEEGIQDPTQFQERYRQRFNEGPGATLTPGAGGGFGPGPLKPSETPGAGDGYGPGPLQPSSTPMNGGGYGPGPDHTPTPGDGDGYGPGPFDPSQTPGSGDGYGPGPLDPSQTPGSGDGYGPGPLDPTQTPGSGDGYGPGPLDPSQTPGSGDGYGPGPYQPTATPQGSGAGEAQGPGSGGEGGNQP